MLNGKNILIGITGGIAAYKICELIRMFKKNNANVKVVITENALNFVTKLTLETLSKNPVYINQFDYDEYNPEHISLANWADAFIVAPLSANTLSKIANGICDNLLTSLMCAYKKEIIIAPAMNDGMWNNKFIQENIKKLKENNYIIIEPEEGYLACGENGKGRLVSVDKLFNTIVDYLEKNKILKNKKIIVTAGGTRENIDPVRYLSNYSSGKMGIAIADRAYDSGADVCLISTFDIDKKYNCIKVDTAEEMLNAVKKEFVNADVLIMAAAVSDYRPEKIAENKIKKDNNRLTLELVKNPDILFEISNIKTDKQIVVGFCAETENLKENATDKVKKKKLDYIVANDISRKDIGFSSDYNEVTIYDKNLNSKFIPKASKKEIAKYILELLYE